MRRMVMLFTLMVLSISCASTYASFSGSSANTGNTFAAASSFCTSPGTTTVTAAADTYVNQDATTTSYGTESSLQVVSAYNQNRRTLVRFSLPTIPSRCTVTAAELRFSVVLYTSGRTLQAWQASGGWTESTTWDTQPGITGTAAQTPSGAGPVKFDVSSQVQAMYAGTNHGFIIRDSSEGSLSGPSQSFFSRETVSKPQLVITFG